MAIESYDKIKQNLLQGNIAPLYFFYGDETYFIDDLAEIASNNVLKPGEDAFNKTVFYGRDADVRQIVDQVRRFPMMAERQLIVLKEAHALKDFGALESLYKKPVPSSVFVVLFKQEKVDKRKSVFKSVMANAVVLESKKLYENQVPIWLNKYMKEKQVKLSPRSIQLLIEYLGTDLTKLTNAVDKLIIHGKEGQIPDAIVEDTIGISRSYNVFELQESIGERNLTKTMKIANLMEKDLKNNPLPMVIPSLFNYFSKLYMIKPFGTNLAEVKRIVRIRSDFIVKKYVAAAKKYSLMELERMIHTLKDFDLKSKGVGVRDTTNEELFKELMLRLVNH